ncbi:hypothetical protein [Endozoicomonas sp. ONNA1]|uniref:hypothetical protein n=1 Tax=Endozoicomonas sp. ONNA1 TaxID=2828740 RepID=UPI002147ABF7|nr:hypothetical protein [Endozoicomonas sp. ONNA1]
MLKPIKYPIDLSANQLSNKIDDEVHVVSDGQSRIIVPHHSVFYSDTVVLTQRNTGVPLVNGTDYTFNYLHEEATLKTGQPVYAVIRIINSGIQGELLLDYQTVGGHYSTSIDAIISAIEDLMDARNIVHWDDILNAPISFPPSIHAHTYDDLVGTEPLVVALQEVAGALQGQHPGAIDALLALLERKVSNTGAVKYGLQQQRWSVNDTDGARLMLAPASEFFQFTLSGWTENIGASDIIVSGHLMSDQTLVNVRIDQVSGQLVPLEFAVAITDGSAINLLARTTEVNAVVHVIVKDFTTFDSTPPESVTVRWEALSTFPNALPSFSQPVLV